MTTKPKTAKERVLAAQRIARPTSVRDIWAADSSAATAEIILAAKSPVTDDEIFTHASNGSLDTVFPITAKLLEAETRGNSWLAEGNKAKENGNIVRAERCYAKGQYWLDRYNRITAANMKREGR